LKLRWLWNWSELRQKLVLTPEEKRVIIFILTAFLLGLMTKCYRDKHRPPIASADAKYQWQQGATPAHSPGQKHKRARKQRPTASPTPASGESG
jgi:hypothetical protein